jgi:predicted methyltransferase
MSLRTLCIPALITSLFAITGCAGTSGAAVPHSPVDSTGAGAEAFEGIIADPDRSAADRALDAGRRPAETLAFFGIERGQRVAELAAGGGYTAELLARAVGPSGTVFGVNSSFLLDRFAQEPWSSRLEKPVMKNVVRVDRSFDDPLPPEATNLDAVLCVLFYHDFFWQDVDRASMNRAVFKALKPGGLYGIVDHSARSGDAEKVVKSLHRIEEHIVRAEIESAGFRLDREGSFLRNPEDDRTWNAAPSAAGDRRGTSDRFVLAFRKPR